MTFSLASLWKCRDICARKCFGIENAQYEILQQRTTTTRLGKFIIIREVLIKQDS